MIKEDGDCYESSAHLILEIGDNAQLCHGVATGQGEIEGIKHGHAWIEMGELVLDFSNGKEIAMLKERYYQIGKIDAKKVKRYSKEDAMRKMIETEHYGPWEE